MGLPESALITWQPGSDSPTWRSFSGRLWGPDSPIGRLRGPFQVTQPSSTFNSGKPRPGGGPCLGPQGLRRVAEPPPPTPHGKHLLPLSRAPVLWDLVLGTGAAVPGRRPPCQPCAAVAWVRNVLVFAGAKAGRGQAPAVRVRRRPEAGSASGVTQSEGQGQLQAGGGWPPWSFQATDSDAVWLGRRGLACVRLLVGAP